MKTLTLVPPAQAEALFDSLEERPRDRFSSLPWQDDDTPQETASQARSRARRSQDSARRLEAQQQAA